MSGVLAIAKTPSTPGTSHDEKVRWRHLLSDPWQGVWDINFETAERYHSPGWYQMRGFSPDHHASSDNADWFGRLHPDDRDAVIERRNALYSHELDELLDEYRERDANGNWLWIMCHGRALDRYQDGRPKRIIGVDVNVSHLKFGSDRDEALDRRLKLAIGASNIGLWEYDIQRDEVDWDQRTRAFYGITETRVRWPGDVWNEFLHPDDKANVLEITQKAVKSGADFNLRFRIIRRDGTVHHLRSRATHVKDQSGNRKILGVTWDISEEAAREAEIAKAAKVIETRNAELEKAQATLEHQSTHDALTGLANRRGLDRFQTQIREQSKNTTRRCAVLQIDLDRFKAINDTLGHAAGDLVLKRVAKILTDAAPENALVARVGGDEFAILIADAPTDPMIGHWANELIRQSRLPFHFHGHECRFSLSIGIASGPFVEDPIDNLFSRADLALYEAKADGRSVARFFSDRQKVAAQRDRQRSDEILAALETGEFGCYYQPQFDITGKTVTGIEALVRWQHPQRGILTPDKFLTLADSLGVTAEIDEQVLKSALRDARRWRKSGLAVPRIYVNISGRRLLDPLLPDRIAFLKDSDIPIGFELLETVFLDQANPNLQTNLSCLRDLKIGIDLDDFGSGHASILCLHKLRPDRIKIDRELIRDAHRDQEQRTIIQAIVDIGRALKMPIVAEGVETNTHIETLKRLGCDHLQGYALSRPVPATEIPPYLQQA